MYLPANAQLTERARFLRHNMTAPERKLWFEFLKNRPYRFLRQKVIAHYIVDFYSAPLMLVIEIDGESHFQNEAISYDMHRTQTLEKFGLQVIRFNNWEVMHNFSGVCDTLEKVLSRRAGL